jgi:spore coat protein CotH
MRRLPGRRSRASHGALRGRCRPVLRVENLEARQMLAADVVISEIMYHPTSENPLDEFIELHNRGDEPANLSGWQLTRGVSFTFGATTIPAGGYLAVAANLARFQINHPSATNVVGGWMGELSNTGERVEISDPLGVPVDEVVYADQGDWALRRRGPLDRNHQGWIWTADHDGAGKSLELINPVQGNNNGQNWSASNPTGGTPGAANSVIDTDTAPIISDVEHSPAVPQSTDDVIVRGEIDDELTAGLTVATHWRTDDFAEYTVTTMFDDGTHGDDIAADGVYAATIPAQPHGTVVEFYVRAVDAMENVRTWPAPTDASGTQGANALYQVDNGFVASEAPLYRLILTETEQFELEQMGNSSENDSNAQMNATFISTIGNDVEVRYNVGQRLRGASSRDFNVKSYRIEIPSDRDWQGVTALNLNARSIYSQIAGSAVFAAAGLPAAEGTLAHVRVNGVDLSGGAGYAQLEVTDGDFVDNHFDDNGGNLYNKRRHANGSDTKWAFRNGNATQYQTDGWDKDTNSGINDWTDLNAFLNAINNAPEATYVASISPHINIEQWLRWFAMMTLLESNETNPSNGVDDDYAMYRGEVDQRFVLLPHDLDSVLGAQGSSTTAGLFRMVTDNGGLPQLARFFSRPEITSQYYAQLRELATTVFSAAQLNPLLQNLLGGRAPQATIDAMQQFAANRVAFVLSQIPTDLTVNSSLSTLNGYLHTTSATTTLSGLAPVEGAHSVRINGQPAEYNPLTGTWTSGLPQVESEVLLTPNSTWKYNDSGANLGTAWQATGYNDAAWLSGPGQLGYGDNDEGTLIACSIGPSNCATNNIITSYFRRTINVEDHDRFTGLIFRVLRDDGVAVYLNGEEVIRENLPANAGYLDPAPNTVGGAAENQYLEFFVSSGMLVEGLNTIAVEVHQNEATSTDVSFDMAIEGLTTDVTPVSFIAASTQWRYHDGGENLGTAWREPNYAETPTIQPWKTGIAELGYGDSATTIINCGPTAPDCTSQNFPTYYFRKTFNVANAAQVASLQLRLLRDDGAAVYINGVEVARDNLPANPTYTTPATTVVNDPNESTFFPFELDPSVLVSGTNVIAVEVHQQAANSSDVSFNLELVGTVTEGTVEENVPLLPGINAVVVQAFGQNNVEIARQTVEIWYDDSSTTAQSGTIASNTTWTAANGPHVVSGELVVAANATLTIEPGATVFFNAGASLNVHGRLLAVGTDTARIRFTKLPTIAGSWGGMSFDHPTQISRLVNVDINGTAGGDTIALANSSIEIEKAVFGPATNSVVAFESSAVLIRDSVFPNTGTGTLISGDTAASGKRVLIERNTFPSRSATSPTIELRAAQRPAVFQIRNNKFQGSLLGGAAVVLRGADAHIEGNYFSGYRGTTGTAIMALGDGALTTRLTLVRNIITNNIRGVAVLEGSRLTSQNNTYTANTQSAVAFAQAGVTVPGQGASFVADILWNNGQSFSGAVVNDPTYGTTAITVNHSLVPPSEAGLGANNITADPQFADAQTFTLGRNSPAIKAGPQQQDLGASVAAGVQIGGEPLGLSGSDATIVIGGAGIVSYLYRVDNGSLQSERPVSQPIVLTGLSNGNHSVQVYGVDSAGVRQGLGNPTNSDTWTVNTTQSRVRISEVLAINQTAAPHNGAFPDFIEFHNDGVLPFDLSGMTLSDDPNSLGAFLFPDDTILGPGEYLVVYGGSSGFNFGLSGAGDGVYLFNSTGTMIDQVVFGSQIADMSIARLPNGDWTLAQPTPGAANIRRITGDATQIVINEWLATGDRLLNDDFVELYNPESLPVSLAGLAITDNLFSLPRRHEFTPLSFIPANGYVVLVNENVDPGDEASETDTVLSFGLSSWRETLALVDANSKPIDVVVIGAQSTDVSQGRSPDASSQFRYFTAPSPGLPNLNLPVATQPVIAIDHVWRYEDSGANLGTAWRQPGYNDTFWSTGAGILHVEDADLPGPKNTPLNLGTPTFYYRAEFDADSIDSTVEQLQLSLLVDDGAVVYLNGQELVRVGMPSGNISHFTFASRHVGTAEFEGPFTIARSSLLPGINVLAIEVHQDDGTSSDTVFAATLDAILPTTDPRTVSTFALLDGLRISEMLYNGNLGVTTEFVELVNISDTTLDLEGVRFTRGIDYTFGAIMLAPGERIVVAQDVATFEAIYGSGINVVGNYTGSLANGGEEIKLTLPSPLTGGIDQFEYSDAWYPTTDGAGYSLVVRDVASDDLRDLASSWRPSYFVGGTPGVDDSGQIVVNEVLANSAAPGGDWIELRNTTSGEVDISSWWLSDSTTSPNKYQIPENTVIPAGGYVVFDEATSFGAATAASPFSLSPSGGAVHLLGANILGLLTGYIETLAYGTSEAGVTIGRITRSDSTVEAVRLASGTPGAANALPQVGPVIIGEVMYHAADGGDEFIELNNPTGSSVPLHSTIGGQPAPWRLAGAVDFSFPANAAIPAGGRVLVVGIDPAAFRTAHNIPAGVAIFGPYTGDLNDAGDDLRLLAPDTADAARLLLIDRVAYGNSLPWPRLADGRGSALIRTANSAYGNDAGSWLASNIGGTPGAVNRTIDTTPPTAPTALTATVASATQIDLAWTAATDAESGVVRYRIFRNGAVVGTSTTTSFADQDAVAGQTYIYEVAAINGDSLLGPRSEGKTTVTLGITLAGALDESRIIVIFSEAVTATTAQNAANYSISGLTINSAALAADGRSVTLATTGMTSGRNYTLAVNGIVGAGASSLPSGVTATFRAGTAGMTVRDVKANSTNAPSNLAQAESLLALPAGHPQILSETTVIASSIDYTDPDASSGGRFQLNRPYPNQVPGVNDDYFALRVTGTIFIPLNLAGAWTFGTRNDDGLRLRINGEDLIVDPSGHGPQDRFGTVNLAAGFHTIELNYWDGIQGALLEFFAARGTFTAYEATTSWRLVGDTAGGGLSVTTQPLPVESVDWERVAPQGSGVFRFAASGFVSGQGSVQNFDVPLVAGQTLSFSVTPASSSAIPVVIVYQDQQPIAAAIGETPGQPIAINNLLISASGEYTIQVQATASTAFDLFAVLNSQIESDASAGAVQQVARRLIDFSSEYTTSSWSAAQTLGAPNTFQYGDYATAWAPEPINGTMEFVTVGYDVPVYATGAVIFESNGNGYVRRVEALDLDGNYHVVWEGTDTSLPGAVAQFRVTFPQTTYLVDALRVTIDTDHDQSTWEEVDAIILEGVQAAGTNDTVETATRLTPQDFGSASDVARLSVSGISDGQTFDFYRIDATAGDVVSLALSTAGQNPLYLQIVDATGQALAYTTTGSLEVGAAIRDYAVPTTGPVYFRVEGTPGDAQYHLAATVNGTIAIEPNNSSEEAIDITASGVGFGYVGEGATGSGEPGPGPTTNFYFNLNDGEGFRWDITSNGSIDDGTSDAYDGGMQNQSFFGFGTGRLENNGREVAIGPYDNSQGIQIARKVYVSDSAGFARFLEIITNTSASPINYSVPIYTNLGSDGNNEFVGTSSGDAAFTPGDLWVVTDDTDGGNDPTMLHVVAGPGGQGPTQMNAVGGGSVSYQYALTLAPGETQIVMHFGAQSSNRAAALAKGNALADLQFDALSGMTALELSQVVNFAPADTADEFSVWAELGDVLTIRTETPQLGFSPYAIGAEGPTGTNSLDPAIELVDAAGNLLASDDNSAGDDRNALINYTVATAGRYQVRLVAKAGSGEYTLSVSGATGSSPQTSVVAATPADGSAFTGADFPYTFTLDLSAGIAPSSVSADDLTVNGIAAETVAQLDGDTLQFTLPVAANTGEGAYAVAIAAGAFTDLTGAPSAAYQSTFTVDASAPRIISATFNGGDFPADGKFSGGPLSIVVEFDEPVYVNQQLTPISVIETNRGHFAYPAIFSQSDNNRTLTLEWPGLREGQYEFEIIALAWADAVGNLLDGEPTGPNSGGTITGDGVPGGSYSLDFSVDTDRHEVNPLWTRAAGLGTLALEAQTSGNITFAGDSDAFVFHLAAGESFDALVSPVRSGVFTARLVDTAGSVVASATSLGGRPAHVRGYRATVAGEYRLEVSGNAVDQDYTVMLTRNAAIESQITTPIQSLDAAASTLAGNRWSVVGNSTPRAIGNYAQSQSWVGAVGFPNEHDMTFTRAGAPTGDAVLNISALTYLEGADAHISLYAEGRHLGNLFAGEARGYDVYNATLTISRSVVDSLSTDGQINLRIVPSQNVYQVSQSSVTIELTYPTVDAVWGVRPAVGDIVIIDPATGIVLRSIPAPDALAPGHTNIGLTAADGGQSLLYINSHINPNLVYRLNPATGAILGTSTVTGAGYDGLGFDGNPATTTIYSADMSTNPNWTFSGGQWAYGTPTGNSGDPTSGFTGPNVVGYNLNGSYANNIGSPFYATTPSINAAGATGTTLSFYRWFRFEGCCDSATIQVTNNGTDWVTVWENTGDDYEETSWSLQTIDISAIADNQPNVRIRWSLGPTDGSVTGGGWNIDDVRVTGLTAADPKLLLSRRDDQLIRQEGYDGTATANWATGSPRGGIAGDDNGRVFAMFTDGLIHEINPDADTNGFIGTPITPPASDIEGLAFDGALLYASTASGRLYAINPTTGAVVSQTNVPLGGLYGLATGAHIPIGDPFAIVPQGSIWKYSDIGQDLGTAWRGRTYDDAQWSSGPSRLGYGGDGEATTVSFGPNAANKHPTTYFRHHFQVDDLSAVESLFMEFIRDDGAAVYLNGTQIARHNVANDASYNTFALGAIDGLGEQQWLGYSVDPSLLVVGDNVIAVEVHQAYADNDDLGFDFRMTATPRPLLVPDIDTYTLDLTGREGSVLDITLDGVFGQSFASAKLELIGPTGQTVVATGQPAAPDPEGFAYDVGILDFAVPTGGVYTLRVTSVLESRYILSVTENSVFDTEQNNTVSDDLRSLDDVNSATGFVFDQDDPLDLYTLNLAAGETVRLSIETPIEGDLFVLDPRIDVYRADGTLIATRGVDTSGANPVLLFTATTAGVYRIGVGADFGIGEYVLSVESVASSGLRVLDITAENSTWSAPMKAKLASAPGSANSLMNSADAAPLTLPWSGIDRLSIKFSEHAVVTAANLRVVGLSAGELAVASFVYDPVTFVATWTLSAPIDADNLALELSDAITSAGGQALDGNSDTTPGGDFTRRFHVLGGDVNGDGRTTVLDSIAIRNHFASDTNAAAYSARADLNGSGTIDAGDLAVARGAMFRTSPVGEPSISTLVGDLNGDGHVGLLDITLLRNQIGVTGFGAGAMSGDLNHDGVVNLADLAVIVSNLGETVSTPPSALVASVSATPEHYAAPVARRARVAHNAADAALGELDALTARSIRRVRTSALTTPDSAHGTPAPSSLRASGGRDRAAHVRDRALSDIIDAR